MHPIGGGVRSFALAVLAAWLVGLGWSRPALAQERERLFTTADAAIAGGFLLGAAALAPVDVRLAAWIQDSVPQANRYLRTGADIFRFLGHPGALAVSGSLYGAGRLLDRPEMAAVGLHTTESILLAVAVTYAAKGLIGRARPYEDVSRPFDVRLGRGFTSDRYQSFPSGHTTAAFATASAVSTEMGYIEPDLQVPIATALFALASLAGVSRMYHNAHWASDVVVGAAIGTFAGWKVVRYHRTRPDDRIDEIFLSRQSPRGPPLVLMWSVPL